MAPFHRHPKPEAQCGFGRSSKTKVCPRPVHHYDMGRISKHRSRAPSRAWPDFRFAPPAATRFSCGLAWVTGKVDRPIRRPINQAGGEAFILAREALDKLKGGRAEKFARTTYVRCAVAPLQDLANLFLRPPGQPHRRHLAKTMGHHQRTHGGSKPGDRRAQVGRRQIHRLKKPAASTLLGDPGFHRGHGQSGRYIARKRATK